MSDTGIEFRLSAPTATTGNSQTQPDPNASLGKFVSSTVWGGTLFADDNLTGTTVYRCVFAANSGSYYTLRGSAVYISGNQPATAKIAIGVDPIFVCHINTATPQATVIASESVAPPGVFFASPVYGTTASVVGDLAPLTCRGLWLRRISAGSVPASDQMFTLRLIGTLTL